MWRADDPQGGESEKVKFAIVRYTRGAGIDLGCGPRKAFPHMIGVDSCKDTELFGIAMKPEVVCDVADPAAIERNFNEGKLDFVFSTHLLEHIEDYHTALRAWWSLLAVGGHLVLYLPHADLYPRRGMPGANPDHAHDFLPSDIVSAMAPIGAWDLVVNQTRGQGVEYSFLQVYRKLDVPGRADDPSFQYAHAFSCDLPRPAKTACVVRHGGFGDQLQAASLFPELKRQGYHLTFLTTPKGRDILAQDPHVDDWFMVDKDQVPNHELVHFWRETAKNYDKFVNLNESVEGTFLAMPGRTQHAWPHALRHKMLDRNYAEFAADLAEIPFKPEGKFYPTDVEKAWVADQVRELIVAMNPPTTGMPFGVRLPRPYIVVWTLSGSSPHKFTPHQDTVIQMILLQLKRAVIMLVGDEVCKILECGWEKEPRVRCRSGALSIRQTLALVQAANLVIGPETGVLNSVAYEPNITKVVLLSHSSRENLTKHWVSTHAIAGVAPCYPCHQLHIDTEFCPQEPVTGAALCQANVSPADIYRPIDADYTAWARVQLLRSAA